MRPIPLKHRKIISEDPYYRTCARADDECSGRITIEHAWTYAGRQISEMWNYVPLCWEHHLGRLLNKKINKAIAYSRATPEELKKYPKAKWQF